MQRSGWRDACSAVEGVLVPWTQSVPYARMEVAHLPPAQIDGSAVTELLRRIEHGLKGTGKRVLGFFVFLGFLGFLHILEERGERGVWFRTPKRILNFFWQRTTANRQPPLYVRLFCVRCGLSFTRFLNTST